MRKLLAKEDRRTMDLCHTAAMLGAQPTMRVTYPSTNLLQISIDFVKEGGKVAYTQTTAFALFQETSVPRYNMTR